MPACVLCSAVNETDAHYCAHCGAALRAGAELTSSGPSPGRNCGSGYSAATGAPVDPESKVIPVSRLLLLTFSSYGAYLFYWFYFTWKQYWDHTGNEAYPVWHALALGVPIYNLFRIYAHAKACRYLAATAYLPDTVIPILPVLLFLFSGAALNAGDFLLGDSETASLGQALASLLLRLTAMTSAAFMLSHLQRPLNRYWQRTEQPRQPLRKSLRAGEAIFLIVGLLFWLATILAIGGAIAG